MWITDLGSVRSKQELKTRHELWWLVGEKRTVGRVNKEVLRVRENE